MVGVSDGLVRRYGEQQLLSVFQHGPNRPFRVGRYARENGDLSSWLSLKHHLTYARKGWTLTEIRDVADRAWSCPRHRTAEGSPARPIR